jgi:hypothetical protein
MISSGLRIQSYRRGQLLFCQQLIDAGAQCCGVPGEGENVGSRRDLFTRYGIGCSFGDS